MLPVSRIYAFGYYCEHGSRSTNAAIILANHAPVQLTHVKQSATLVEL